MLKVISTSMITAALLLSSVGYAADATTTTTTTATPSDTAMSQDSGMQSMAMSPEDKQKWADKWANMTPEQKADIQKKMAEHWKNATPDQKKAVVEHFVMKFKSLPNEQQQQILEKLKQVRQDQ